MTEITIDPTTRIEGHHGTTLTVEDGEVVDAKSEMKMFRGVEIITLDRPPSDAPHLTGKVCGVCFTCHRWASSMALEDAAENAGAFDGIPPNARYLRDSLEALFYLWNHAVHLYALVGPDYSDAVAGTGLTRLDPLEGEGYQEALRQQRKLLKAFSEFGGRTPHPLTYTTGGMAGKPDATTIQQVKSRFREVSRWLGPTEAVPEVIENVQAGEFDRNLGAGLHDLVGLILAAADAGMGEQGLGPDRFLSNGVFVDPENDGLFHARGVYRDGQRELLDRDEMAAGIFEDTAWSWYTDDSAGHPAEAKPPEPVPDKADAYSWGKAPRFDGEPCEVGPLARMIVSDLDPFDLRAALGGGTARSSTLNRLIARAQEALVIRDLIADLLDLIDLDEPFMAEWDDDFTGQGYTLTEAARGALSHWVSVEDGKIDQYQIITPTLWNLGPRDEEDQRGIYEQAVVGIPVEDLEHPLDVLRTTRSFDPCLACSVHVQSPENSFETLLEPPRPGAAGGE